MRHFLFLLLPLLLHQPAHSHTTNKPTFYDILELPATATKREIKKAYRKKAVLLHPDKHEKAEKEKYEALFVELAEAYSVLSDDDKRQDYDTGKYSDAFHSTFEEAFKTYGYDGVQDTPANWFALVLVTSMLVIPCCYVGFKKLQTNDNATAARNELLHSRGLVPKTTEEIKREEQRKQQFQEQQDERAKQKVEQRALRKEQAERAAAKEAMVVTAKIQAHKPAHPHKPRSGMHDVQELEIQRASVPFTEAEKIKFNLGAKKYGNGTPNRWQRIAQYMGTRDKIGVTKHVKALKNVESQRLNKLHTKKKQKQQQQQQQHQKNATINTMATTVAKEDDNQWTTSQQAKLEDALRSVPRTLPKEERWSEIAQRVGKSRSECVKRFKELRAKLLKR